MFNDKFSERTCVFLIWDNNNCLTRAYKIQTAPRLAFDHFTLSEDPRQNIQWFFEQLPEDITLDLDVVTHSRGGLVARVLTEAPPHVAGRSTPRGLRRDTERRVRAQ